LNYLISCHDHRYLPPKTAEILPICSQILQYSPEFCTLYTGHFILLSGALPFYFLVTRRLKFLPFVETLFTQSVSKSTAKIIFLFLMFMKSLLTSSPKRSTKWMHYLLRRT
jgi:hypothetical protein